MLYVGLCLLPYPGYHEMKKYSVYTFLIFLDHNLKGRSVDRACYVPCGILRTVARGGTMVTALFQLFPEAERTLLNYD